MSQNTPYHPQPLSPTPPNMYSQGEVYKSETPLPVAEIPPQFVRADLEFIDVDHSGPSFEARVFVNNANANMNTPPTESNGYAGCFNVFGHGGCFGDVGHCDIPDKPKDSFDRRPSHPLLPMKKVVIATSAIRKALDQHADIKVTVVPIIKSWTDKTELTNVLKFNHINLITYR